MLASFKNFDCVRRRNVADVLIFLFRPHFAYLPYCVFQIRNINRHDKHVKVVKVRPRNKHVGDFEFDAFLRDCDISRHGQFCRRVVGGGGIESFIDCQQPLKFLTVRD